MSKDYVFDLGVDCPPVEINLESLQLSGYGKNTINGVAFTSHDGSSTSGFNYSFGIMREFEGETYFDMNFIRKHKIRSPYSHNLPTEYFPLVQNHVDMLNNMGIEIFRCRLSKISGSNKIPLHRDTPSARDYCVKVHIPVITNNHARFIFSDKQYKMDVGRMYVANVAELHEFDNPSSEDRYHIIADCMVKNKDLPLYCDRQPQLVAYYTAWDKLMDSPRSSDRWFRQDQYGCWEN